MYIIKIPNNLNKYDYVCKLLNKLLKQFDEYDFCNCTVSPINEYSYVKINDIYYRKIKSIPEVCIDELNYIESYKNENLKSQGITLQDYIEMCKLFELEKIILIEKFEDKVKNLLPLATILICPDGLSEMHFDGQDKILASIVDVLKN